MGGTGWEYRFGHGYGESDGEWFRDSLVRWEHVKGGGRLREAGERLEVVEQGVSARAVMMQGTASDVGKSVVVAGLCRAARRRGLRVAPFKPQNMSNNAAACEDGGEIGRAQAVQARAAGLAPRTDFNPVLLKPQTDRGSQVVVHGRPVGMLHASDYRAGRARLMDAVMESFARLVAEFDLVIVEGAGSPAEVNLRAGDIANMGFARRAEVPVCLVGDIDRGGVIAAVVGTGAVLDAEDRALIAGFLINKLRGDPALFEDGVRIIERHTGWPCFGVIPWEPAALRLAAEDAASLPPAGRSQGGRVKVAAPVLSRLANYDDADPLRLEPDVEFAFVPAGRSIPRDADVVMLFGTKSTIGDLAFLRAQGWDHDILAHARAGGRVVSVCGGCRCWVGACTIRRGRTVRRGRSTGWDCSTWRRPCTPRRRSVRRGGAAR